MTHAIIQFVISSTVVVIAAVALTRFADSFAKVTGLGQLIVGTVLLAGATSLPELSVNWAIVKLDLPDMAIGGLIGSSLFNLGILAFADLTHKARGIMFSRKSVENALPGVVSIGMMAVVGIGIFVGDKLGSLEFAGLGIFAIILFVAYLLGLRLIYHDQLSEKPARKAEEKSETSKPDGTEKSKSVVVTRVTLGFICAAIIILIAAPYSAAAAATIAESTGLGSTFVGTTLVALATSLPELVACLAAVRIGSMNLAIGNIFGSNTFNLLLLIPLDFGFTGSLVGAASSTHLLTCMLVILVTSVIIVGQLYRVETRRFLIEPDAALVLLLVSAGLTLIYFCK